VGAGVDSTTRGVGVSRGGGVVVGAPVGVGVKIGAGVGAGVKVGVGVPVGVAVGAPVGVGAGVKVGVGVGVGLGVGVGVGAASSANTSDCVVSDGSVQFFVRKTATVHVVAPFPVGTTVTAMSTESWDMPPSSQSTFVAALAVTTDGLPLAREETQDLPSGTPAIASSETTTAAGIETLTQPMA
jgi:hypothetical protein